jgi:hypothetical protein
VALASDVGVERAAPVTDVGGGDSQILDRRSVLFDRICVSNGQRFTHPFRTIFGSARTSREMESVDIAGAVLLDHSHDALAQPGEN